MKSQIDFVECLKDSPKFRTFLDEQETVVDHLELKLERAIKMCTIAVDSGKEYIKNQSAFATSLWELQSHFEEHKSAHNALGKIIHCLQEMNKFHTILLDQASRTILKNLTSYVKTDIKEVKVCKQVFLDVSEKLDNSLVRNAQVNKNRLTEVTEAANFLSAATSCFRHTSLDYVSLLVMLQSKKVPEILSTLLNYYQACSTFYHQGTDLCNDFDRFFKGLADDIEDMNIESKKLEKTMQNRHLNVSTFSSEATVPTKATASVTPSTTIITTTTTTTNAVNLNNSQSSDDESRVSSIEGYLFKRTSKGFKSWNRRWFYLCDNQLVYRKRGHGEAISIMETDLRICTVRPLNDIDRRFCFEVISPTKSHILQADSAELLHTWITTLHKCIGAAIQSNRSDLTVQRTNPNSFDYNNMAGRNDSLPGASNFKKINWQQFLKIPGNSKCCDCGNPEPRWASINLGITLCISCSGVHRSLGVHYSKVRSLTLDGWEPEIVKVMMELGNMIVNRIYEANVDDSVKRASENCENDVRDAWIKAKYIERKFVLPIMLSGGCGGGGGLLNTNFATHQQLEDPNEDVEECSIKPATSVARRWSVRRVRRRPKCKSRKNSLNNLMNTAEKTTMIDEEEIKQNVDDSCSGGDSSSNCGVVVFGQDLINSHLLKDELALSSDQESTAGEDENQILDEEDIGNLTPNLLLYKASAAHNLPVMCQAFALGASKSWSNPDDFNRTHLHQAIFSGSVMACEYLLLNGIPIDSCDDNGYSALHLATERGCTAQAYLLLKHCAKHDILAKNNKKPIDIAVEQANADIVTLLRLTRLNEEIRSEDQGAGEGDTYTDVMKDFSRFAVSQPHRLQRNNGSFSTSSHSSYSLQENQQNIATLPMSDVHK